MDNIGQYGVDKSAFAGTLEEIERAIWEQANCYKRVKRHMHTCIASSKQNPEEDNNLSFNKGNKCCVKIYTYLHVKQRSAHPL